MKQAKITALTGNGTWNGQHGPMYSFNIEFDDDQVGQVNAKTESPPYAVGDSVFYEVTQTNSFGDKLKVGKSDPNAGFSRPSANGIGGGDRETIISNSWALNASINIIGPLTAAVTVDDYLEGIESLALQMLKLRDSLTESKDEQGGF